MPQLSCEQCRSRKTRCDKQSPCSACRSAGLRCHAVERARLPRGRSGKDPKKSAALECRVARLEALLQQASAGSEGSGAVNAPSTRCLEHIPADGHADRLSEYVASGFWASLSQEVAGLRETLESTSDEDQPSASAQPVATDATNRVFTASVLYPLADSERRGLPEASSQAKDALFSTYRARVDSVFKPLHWPTVYLDISSDDGYKAPVSCALKSAILYMASCSLSDDECEQQLGCAKSSVLPAYRKLTEVYIAETKLLQRPTVMGLQAFVVYLQALRTCKVHALSWTLVATAVRLAEALGLGCEEPSTMSTLALETRRRLWYCICIMDTQATLDRGSAPLILAKALGPPPQYINDEDLLSDTAGSSTIGSDMYFSAMTFEAMICHKRICELASSSEDGWQSWGYKIQLVEDLQRCFRENYSSIDVKSATPIQILTKMGSQSIAVNMQLLLRRPPYKQSRNAIPPWDDFDILGTATEVLERNILLGAQQLSLWAWKEWTPWYALAVVLGELCRAPHGPAADRGYTAACESFDRYAVPLDDLDSGMLWKPISILLRRVRLTREERTPGLARPDAVATIGNSGAGPTLDHDMSTTAVERPTLITMHPANIGHSTNGISGDGLDLFDMIDLEPESGVSWLSWDLLLQERSDNLEWLY